MRRRIFLMACLMVGWAMSTNSLAEQGNDLKLHADCKYCGMHRDRLAHSRMLLHYNDGTAVGVCSIHCAAINYITSPSDAPVLIEVGDYQTRRLINAQAAWWVIGGSKTGVMTNRAKWAFEARRDALAYIGGFGGQIADFDGAMKASYEDMYEDMRTLKELQLEYQRSRRAALNNSK